MVAPYSLATRIHDAGSRANATGSKTRRSRVSSYSRSQSRYSRTEAFRYVYKKKSVRAATRRRPLGMVSGTSHAPTRPISWYCGNQETFESVSVTPSRVRINAQFARTCVTPTTTPLGAPVDPDVNCTNATFVRDASSASSSFFSSSLFLVSRLFASLRAARRDAFQRHERERNVFENGEQPCFEKRPLDACVSAGV